MKLRISAFLPVLALLCCNMATAHPAPGPKSAPKGSGAEHKTSGDAAAIERGKLLYVKATCWGCHPRGDNSLNGDKPLRGAAFQKKYPTDEVLAQFIRKGNQDAGMPGFPRESLSDGDLKLIIGYIRSLTVSNAK